MQGTNVLKGLLNYVSHLNKGLDADLASLRSYLGDNVAVQAESDDCGHRIILMPQRNKITQLSKHCNLIFEYPGWDVLVRGPPLIGISGGAKDLAKNLHQYQIYKIQDGTTVTLYHRDHWQMATAHSVDVSSLQWMGDITYAQALAKIMSIEGWSFDSLDPTLQYTIGFRHHHFHPLLKDPESSWLIQISSGATIVANGENPIHIDGMKWQVPTTIPQFSSGGKKTNNLTWMRSENATALSNYISSDGDEIHYGYLLRHPIQEDILLESTLLTFVRRSIYDLPKTIGLTAETRIDYIVLRAYLSYTSRYDFRTVFPQFESRTQKINSIINKVHREVMERLKCTDVIIKAPGSFDEHIGFVAAMLVKNISSFAEINVMNADGSEIVRDFIVNPDYLDQYHALCCH